MEKAERAYDLNKVAELRHGKIPQLEAELKKLEKARQERRRFSRRRSPREEIAEVVAKWTGVPVTRLVEGEKEKLLRLEDVLHERVIGQDEAVTLVTEAILRARSGIKDPRRPVGSFLFLGPTGVGKTELAKALAETLFDTEAAMVRHRHVANTWRSTRVARLIGAPPGYVGYDEGGQLTEAVRRKPYAVVLFDEIEKAHPDVFNVAAAGARRRPHHRRAGPHGGFQEHDHHHDVEHRLALPARGRDGRRDPGERARERDGRAAQVVPSGIPQPDRRDDPLQAADAGGNRRRSWTCCWPT